MNYNLQTGINLDGRTLSLNIPDNTSISELKYIAKTENSNNYIAENNNQGYVHYVDSTSTEHTDVFYVKGSTNLTEITLPDSFGTVVEIDDTSVLYQYVKRTSHEKVYLISEDYGRVEVGNADEASY